ncbi:MAG: ATP-binding cassette domain-containing protein [Bacteroidales bacterium]|nr:ATP-binding cassette domain-containing protein [Bacteroidales bacterium]
MSRRNKASATDHLDSKKLNLDQLRSALKIFEFVRPYRWRLVVGLVLLFISSMVFMVFPFLSGELINIAQGKSNYSLSLEQVGIFLVIVLVAQGFVSYYRVQLFAAVSERGIADVRKALYAKIITMPIVFFEKNRVGDLVSRLTADVEKLYNAFSLTIAEFIRQIIVLVSGIIILAFMAPKLSLIMLATFPVIVVGAMFFGRKIRKLSKQRQDELANSNTVLSETMTTIQVVKAFTNELFENLRYGKSVDETVVVSLKYARGRALFSVFIVSVLFGGLFFVIWMGAWLLSKGQMDAGQLVSFVVYTAVIGGAIAGLGNFYSELLGSIGATERIREILEETSEVKIVPPSKTAKRLQGDIEFKDVHFNYPTREDVRVLKGINLSVGAGEKVALVGPCGAGKSTIVQLLLKFYAVKEGDITVDGKSIYDMTTSDYRQNIAIVPQEVLLFGGTIRENILYGKPHASELDIIEAARQANAWDFIQRFPDGLDTIVGERGVKLSGGQRQRIAIARAILKNPAILLLDEATSSLDAESEKVVQEALDKLMEGRTSIIIAHRLATVRNVDKICVIDGGRIVEEGTHEELEAMSDGLYNSLAKLQFHYA